jgi:hypothetical protein
VLSDEDMRRIIEEQPHGPIRQGPNLMSVGVTNLEGFVRNLAEGAKHSRRAMRLGCYVEVISLRLQHTELWLRLYWVAKNRKRKTIPPGENGPTFGAMIHRCKELGFRADLIERLSEFNDDRKKAIHHYLMGDIQYSDLKQYCQRSEGLDGDVREYVISEIGIEL